MSAELEPDLCVVGGGPGGLTAAFGAAAAGKSVVLIEKDALGGRRLSEVLPRQALLAAVRAADSVRGAARFGIEVQAQQADFARLRQQIAATVATVAPNYSMARAQAMNVKVIRAVGRFTGPGTCEAGGERIKARQFVVATGAEPKRLSPPGIDTIRPLDSAALCGLDCLPERLIVLGADPEGLALAQAFRRLGSEVAIFTDQPLFPLEDEELAAPVRAAFARDGIAVHENARIARIEPRGSGVRIILSPAGQEAPVTGSHLFVAAGYSPAVEGLGLSAAGVRYDERGIETNLRLVTSNGRIFAIGAAVKGGQQEGTAEWHAHIVLRAILGLPGGKLLRESGVRLVLTSPPIAVAGVSEATARAANRPVCVLRWPLAEAERAQIEHQPAGHVKLVTSRSGRILGAGIVGPGAEELIVPISLAISKGMTAAEVATTMIPYPLRLAALRSASVTFRQRQSFDLFSRLLLSWNQLIALPKNIYRDSIPYLAEKARHIFR